ncbi:MAG: signal peptidase I [Acutalibacteraceae bacterium]
MKHKKAFLKRLISVICSVILLLSILCTCYVMISSMNGKAAVFFGKSVLRVVSGSMQPTLYEGDYILVDNIPSNQLKKGDIIAFYSTDESIYGMLNTHRIVAVNDDGSLVTKGDANSTVDDTFVTADRIIGKYVGKMRFFKWVNSFQSANKLIILGVIGLALLMSVYECRTIYKISRLSDDEKKDIYDEKREKLIREAIDKEKQRLYEQNEQDRGGDKD